MLYPTNSRWNKYMTSGSEMTVRRSRFASVPPPGYFSSTKGHSALRKWSYFPPSRAATYSEDIGYYPDFVRPRTYDTTREENEIRRDVNSELMYTSNLMDDTYDIAARSRNRDQTLLRDATRALVDTETYSSPRSSATSRRVRQSSVVRTPAVARAVSCPPVRASNQAALVGNKVEVVTPRRRHPRSAYAANKMREMKRDEREMEVEAVPIQSTTSLKASAVSPGYDGGKVHWDEDGKLTQPKNLLSWQYRIESRVPPGDYLFPIKTIGHVRDKLLHVKEGMDRHKQLMDRYLPDEDSKTDVKTKIMNMYVDMEHNNP